MGRRTKLGVVVRDVDVESDACVVEDRQPKRGSARGGAVRFKAVLPAEGRCNRAGRRKRERIRVTSYVIPDNRDVVVDQCGKDFVHIARLDARQVSHEDDRCKRAAPGAVCESVVHDRCQGSVSAIAPDASTAAHGEVFDVVAVRRDEYSVELALLQDAQNAFEQRASEAGALVVGKNRPKPRLSAHQ